MSLLGLSCIFPSLNIKKTAEFYTEKLDFTAVEYLKCEQPHICLYKDDIEIILTQSNGNKILPNHVLYGYGYDVYLYTNDQITLQEKFKTNGVKIIKPLTLTDYNNNEFVIEDIDGRWVAFGLKRE